MSERDTFKGLFKNEEPRQHTYNTTKQQSLGNIQVG